MEGIEDVQGGDVRSSAPDLHGGWISIREAATVTSTSASAFSVLLFHIATDLFRVSLGTID